MSNVTKINRESLKQTPDSASQQKKVNIQKQDSTWLKKPVGTDTFPTMSNESEKTNKITIGRELLAVQFVF